MTTIKTRLVACPNCKKPSEFTPNNPFRPFCCERCKMIDLGLWANEEYAIVEPINADELPEEFGDGIARQ